MFLIKPDAFRRRRVGTVLRMLEAYDIIDMEFFRFSVEFVDEFYIEHKEKDFYPQLQATMISGYSLAIMIQENWAPEMRDMVTVIRNEVGLGFNSAENAVHCSDSADADIKECDLIFGRHI